MENHAVFLQKGTHWMFEPKIDIQQALAGLRKREKGLITYEKIMSSYKNINLSEDMSFQRMFNGFYRIRRNEDWRKFYYENFEKWKNESTPTFPLILETFYRHTGRVECSFSSKMLATLCPDFPIWDSIVLDRLQLRLRGTNCETKFQNALPLYKHILQWYQEFLPTQTAKSYIAAFDDAFPQYKHFTPTKKIDFLLWASPKTK